MGVFYSMVVFAKEGAALNPLPGRKRLRFLGNFTAAPPNATITVTSCTSSQKAALVVVVVVGSNATTAALSDFRSANTVTAVGELKIIRATSTASKR